MDRVLATWFGDGDPQRTPWKVTAGTRFGGIMAPTDVPGILRWDCVATDWFHSLAYPTWLFYNPYSKAKTFHTDVGPAPTDLYDAVERDFVKRAARGRVRLTLPPDTAAVIVAAPAGAKLTHHGRQRLIEGVVVDFDNETE